MDQLLDPNTVRAEDIVPLLLRELAVLAIHGPGQFSKLSPTAANETQNGNSSLPQCNWSTCIMNSLFCSSSIIINRDTAITLALVISLSPSIALFVSAIMKTINCMNCCDCFTFDLIFTW